MNLKHLNNKKHYNDVKKIYSLIFKLVTHNEFHSREWDCGWEMLRHLVDYIKYLEQKQSNPKNKEQKDSEKFLDINTNEIVNELEKTT